MWGSRLLIGLVAAAATLSTATSCSRPNEAAGDLSPATSIGLTVTNQNFADMDVYAVSDGLATRLGTVTGNTTRSFALHGSMATSDLRIVATPIGGNGRASSGSLIVSPGQTIDFKISPVLRNSTVSIR
jgi:hypothetical protein